jgi:serine/threonine protein kinase
VVGKHPQSKADSAANTLLSPASPEYRAAAAVPELPAEQGARSSERIIASSGANAPQGCLARQEVLAYLGRACPPDVRARVDTHVTGCVACRRWVAHLDDHILEYMGGQLPEEELTRMDAHLEACSACRELMHHVVQGMAQSWDGSEQQPANSSTTFAIGSVVNSRYRIESFIGRGGMGEVYEAFDQLMDRRVALKTVLCNVADRPRASRRFKEEVLNAQRVGHSHVCRINELQEHHGAGFAPPLPFFTMEFIEGERLGRRLQAGALPVEEVRIIALQLLAGLEAAHERGVLHLDFKSDNVMLRSSSAAPDAVIMDFGLSRVLGSESHLRSTDRRQFAGTLSYMSVEQLECRSDLGPATDVYGFGVVLYEMLTQGLPFYGDSLSASLLKQLKERAKPPSRFAPELSPALDRFVLKCLSNDAQLRYADAGQALAALQAIGSWTRPRGLARFWKVAIPVATLSALVAVLVLRNADPARPDAAPPSEALPSEALPPGPAAPTAVEQLTRELNPAAPAVDSAPAAPASEAPASNPKPPAAVPRHRPPPRTAAISISASASAETARAAPLPEPEAPAAAANAPEWKPARVPKRLGSPAP